MGAVCSDFCQLYLLPALITSSEQCGRDSVSAHTQLSHVYLASTLDIMHVIKCTSGESLGTRLREITPPSNSSCS